MKLAPHRITIPFFYAAFSILFVLALTTSFYYSFKREVSPVHSIKNLVLLFAGVALVAIMYCYLFDPLEIVKFPRTDFGLAFFSVISFPVILLHRFLESTGLQIPTYVGVFLGICLILANQTLFHVYFVSIDEEVLPRFLFRLGLPLSLTAATGVVKSTFTLSETNITVKKPDQSRLTTTLAVILIVVLLVSAGLSAFINISKFTPHTEQGDYYAALWLGGLSPENSTLETHYPQDIQVYTALTHLAWPGTPAENIYFVQVRPKAMFQYNWNQNPVDKVYSSREDTIRFYYRENRTFERLRRLI